ncbi:MAG TPA: alanine dehydrogenase, partial [Saprospiraceae bacterium]|nr:alanine dehydrogenase [Saprospiraceae bacterium]
MSNPENFFSSVFPKGHLLVKESPLKIPTGSNELLIGIPKETLYQENRVPLVPSSVHNITLHGHKVIIESGAGENSFYTDTEYSEAGAEITESKKRVYDADIILKVSPPTLEELDLFHRGQILVSPLQFPVTTKEYIKKLVDKRVIAIAMEYMQAEDKSFPVVKIMSEITGTVAVLTAAEYLSEPKLGKRVLLGSI